MYYVQILRNVVYNINYIIFIMCLFIILNIENEQTSWSSVIRDEFKDKESINFKETAKAKKVKFIITIF